MHGYHATKNVYFQAFKFRAQAVLNRFENIRTPPRKNWKNVVYSTDLKYPKQFTLVKNFIL